MTTIDTKLWMGDIKPWMNEVFLMNSFMQFGFRPNGIQFFIDENTKAPKNYCFVKFNSSQEATNALIKLNGERIPNSRIYFKLNLSKQNNKYKVHKNLYVGNLPPEINDIELFNYFNIKYPSVYNASIIRDGGVSRGYGFIRFSNEREYYQCLKEMDGTMLYKNKIIVKPKIFDNKQQSFVKNKFSLNNYIEPFYNIKNIECGTFGVEETESSVFGQEKDGYPKMDKETSKNENFIDNLKIIESDDNFLINQKIKEKLSNILGYYNNSTPTDNKNEIPKALIYYGSNF